MDKLATPYGYKLNVSDTAVSVQANDISVENLKTNIEKIVLQWLIYLRKPLIKQKSFYYLY